MYQIVLILVMLIIGGFTKVKSQTINESQMQTLVSQISTQQTAEDLMNLSNQFSEISEQNPKDWLPIYYALLTKTLSAFQLKATDAVNRINEIENQFDQLYDLNESDEVLVLRGLFRTVKVAKQPEIYGMVLPSSIIRDYSEAQKINPNNPRAMYLLAQFKMKSGEFFGENPRNQCPKIHEAKALYQKENNKNLEPSWGEKLVDEIIAQTCN